MKIFFAFGPGLAASLTAMLFASRMPPLTIERTSALSAVLIPTPVPASSALLAAGSPRCSASRMRPYDQPPPPGLSASIPERRNLNSDKKQAPFAESGCKAFVVLWFVMVNSSIAELRSANPFPLQLILIVRFPVGLKVCPAGEK